MTRIQTLRFVCAMKRDVVRSIVIFLLLSLVFALVSCEEKIPDLSKKERDPRLLGQWTRVEEDEDILPSEVRTLEFKLPGYCISFAYSGSWDFFYTEEDNHLFIVIPAPGFKYSGWAHEYYYLVEKDKFYLWSSKADMLARKYQAATMYIKASKS